MFFFGKNTFLSQSLEKNLDEEDKAGKVFKSFTMGQIKVLEKAQSCQHKSAAKGQQAVCANRFILDVSKVLKNGE